VAQVESGLLETVGAISRRWRLIAMVALSVVVGATLYTERQPSRYEASAIMAVIPRGGHSSADLVVLAAPRFASYLTAPATIRKVAGRLGEDADDLQQQVNATIVPDTANITITVGHLDPLRATVVANELGGQLRRASASDRLVMVQSVAPAVLPAGPAGPPRRLIEAAALVAGLLLGLGLAALLDAVQGRPARPPSPGAPLPAGPRGRALPELGRYPVVGEVPSSPALRSSVAGALADPAVDTAIGTLTANLARPLGRDLRGTIVVTSPGSHQGKTTVAQLLAASRLRAGDRVLRVDGQKDHLEVLRARKDHENGHSGNPSEEEPSAEPGLHWVKDLWVAEDGMWVLPAARGPVAVALAEGREAEILDEARAMFDCIIIDAPPVLDDEPRAPAATTLVSLADAVLLVLSPDSTAESLYRSVEALREVPGPFAGVVLNQVPEPTSAGSSSNIHRLEARPS
jgi:Mrp family chromosome partitioning ATPase/capsular polysaccharide biosynthesis protein